MQNCRTVKLRMHGCCRAVVVLAWPKSSHSWAMQVTRQEHVGNFISEPLTNSQLVPIFDLKEPFKRLTHLRASRLSLPVSLQWGSVSVTECGWFYGCLFWLVVCWRLDRVCRPNWPVCGRSDLLDGQTAAFIIPQYPTPFFFLNKVGLLLSFCFL